MNKRLALALPLVLLLGCSTPPSPPEPAAPWVQYAPPLEKRPGQDASAATFCQLGASCMAMDPRPFEACLVSGKTLCIDKATEPLLVVDPSPGQPKERPPQAQRE